MTNKSGVLGHIGLDSDGVPNHEFPVIIYWEDTDAGGIVYHANYLKFTERARSDLLKYIDINQQQMLAEEAPNFVVRDCTIEFLRPAKLEDVLTVKTTLIEMKSATLKMQQDIYRGDEVLIKSAVRIACLQKNGTPARFSAQIRDKFASLVKASGATL